MKIWDITVKMSHGLAFWRQYCPIGSHVKIFTKRPQKNAKNGNFRHFGKGKKKAHAARLASRPHASLWFRPSIISSTIIIIIIITQCHRKKNMILDPFKKCRLNVQSFDWLYWWRRLKWAACNFLKAPKIGLIFGSGHIWGNISDMKLLLQGYWGCRVVNWWCLIWDPPLLLLALRGDAITTKTKAVQIIFLHLKQAEAACEDNLYLKQGIFCSHSIGHFLV